MLRAAIARIPLTSASVFHLTRCMVRPCIARSFIDLVCGLASMYPASDWSGVLPRATMDISARSISLADRPRRANGSPVFDRAGKTGLVSSLPLADLGGGKLGSLPLHRAAPLLLPHFSGSTGGPFPRPDLCALGGIARRAGQGRPSCLVSRLARRFQAGLDETEHGAKLMRAGAMSPSSSLRILVLWRALPRRYARACWRVRSPAHSGAAASSRPRSTA